MERSIVCPSVRLSVRRTTAAAATGGLVSCGGATDGGSACEATGRTENRKWSILSMLRLNYLREQHLRKVNIQVSSFRQDIFKMYL